MKHLTHKEYTALSYQEKMNLLKQVIDGVEIGINKFGDLVATNLQYQDSDNKWHDAKDFSAWDTLQYRIKQKRRKV